MAEDRGEWTDINGPKLKDLRGDEERERTDGVGEHCARVNGVRYSAWDR